MTASLPVVTAELRAAAAHVRAAARELDTATLRAHRAGLSNRQIAELTDRTHPTVARTIERLTSKEHTP